MTAAPAVVAGLPTMATGPWLVGAWCPDRQAWLVLDVSVPCGDVAAVVLASSEASPFRCVSGSESALEYGSSLVRHSAVCTAISKWGAKTSFEGSLVLALVVE
eukprot:COSAG06_NODE_44825_length_360_cov_0.670498_1_plen_102_part_01